MNAARRAIGLACLLALAAGGTRAEDAASGSQLEELRRAIEARRERVSAYERQERSLFDAIEAADTAARALRLEVARLAEVAREADRERAELEAASRALEAKVAITRRALAARAVALYKAGAPGPLRIVFTPGPVRDRLARIQALQLLLDHDQALLTRFGDERAALTSARAEAGAAASRYATARKALAGRERELAEEREAKRTLLEDVVRDSSQERAMLAELEAAARALAQKLSDLGAEPGRSGAIPFASRRGALAPPVSGRQLRGFGRVLDAEFRTETFRKGIDFAAEIGDPVGAVADGVVRFADWFHGYGRMLILDHGDGFFSVSGHLDSFEVELGEEVVAGQRIGSAGDTGSLSGPRLYFEIRQGSEALDPGDWLRLPPGG